MPRPCGHPDALLPAPGSPYAGGCRPCWLYANRPDYRRLWAAAAPPAPGPCRHLGPPTGEARACKACGGRGGESYPVHACARHGRCVDGRSFADLANCRVCDDRDPLPAAAPEYLPGHPDPLPAPELSPPPPGWANRRDVRDAHAAALAEVLARPHPPPPGLAGDGVLYVGGGRYWPGIVVGCRLLREAGCRLPVQVWHRGPDEPADPADVAGLGVEVIDALAVRGRHPARVLRGWEAKAFALAHCGWRRVLYLDADAYLVADPAPLFALLGGAPFVYWSDLPNTVHNVKWDWFGVAPPGDRVPPVQGGQLLFDLAACWQLLACAHWLNQHSDYFYSKMYGDQDAWRVVLAALPGVGHRCLGRAPWRHPAFLCGHGGADYVVHRCQGKFLLPPARPPARNDRLPLEGRAFELYREATRTAIPPGATAAEAFGVVYRRGDWGADGLSGAWSDPAGEAAGYLDRVEACLRWGGVASAADLGTGDGRVLRALAARLPGLRLAGVDCHAPHVDRLAAEAPGIDWHRLDLDRDRDRLPAADVALVKDVLHHWPTALVADWVQWAARCGKWRRVLLTQDREQRAEDCPLGGYRGLDPDRPPLGGLGLRRLADVGHKAMLLLDCGGGP